MGLKARCAHDCQVAGNIGTDLLSSVRNVDLMFDWQSRSIFLGGAKWLSILLEWYWR